MQHYKSSPDYATLPKMDKDKLENFTIPIGIVFVIITLLLLFTGKITWEIGGISIILIAIIFFAPYLSEITEISPLRIKKKTKGIEEIKEPAKAYEEKVNIVEIDKVSTISGARFIKNE